MKVAFFDAFSGISGDMVMGALLDAGLSLSRLRKELKKLGLQGYILSARKIKRNSITATFFQVKVTKKQKSRSYAEIVRMIKKSSLDEEVKAMSLEIFRRIAEAESEVHGQPVEKVHFHEIGAVDSIIDVVGTTIGFCRFNIKRFECSPIPTGSGLVKTSHGTMPVPAPATLLLLKGIPIKMDEAEMELTTPTGAGIAAVLSSRFGAMPPMITERVGYGAGARERKDSVPNLLRLVIGESGEEAVVSHKRLLVIETNLDDATPENISHAVSKLLASGALDVWVTPVMMKKGRQSFTLSLLCETSKAAQLRELVLEETPSIGLRQYEVDRFELPRKVLKVKTGFGDVRVKVAVTPSGEKRFKPEFDDVAKLAGKKGVSYEKVYNEALAQARKK